MSMMILYMIMIQYVHYTRSCLQIIDSGHTWFMAVILLQYTLLCKHLACIKVCKGCVFLVSHLYFGASRVTVQMPHFKTPKGLFCADASSRANMM